MSFWENVRSGVRSVVANRLRSALTALGIIIGVATVIALVAVGAGARQAVLQQLRSLGTNVIFVTPGPHGALTEADVRRLSTAVPTIRRVAPVLTDTLQVGAGRQSLRTTVMGVTAAYTQVRGGQVAAGRFVDGWDEMNRSHVAVLGWKAASDLFPGRSPIGGTILVDGQDCTVVGVMAPRGTTLNLNNDTLVFLPLATAQQVLGTWQLSSLYVQAASAVVAPITASQISRIYTLRYHDPHAMQVNSQDQLISANSTASRTLTLLLGSVAAVSLLVGGIGIMNIMLVSVTERTREIGLRKAIGATAAEIMIQFLIEALLLSIGGGLVGVGSGIVLARLLARVGHWNVVVSPQSAAVAFAFAALVGIVFGLYPARRASLMDPIDALRSE